MGYRVTKKAWQYVQPFWYNTSVWRTDRRTDGQTDGRTDVQPISITCFSIADARKNNSSCLQHCKNYKNRSRFSRVMITNVLPPFYGSQCILYCWSKSKAQMEPGRESLLQFFVVWNLCCCKLGRRSWNSWQRYCMYFRQTDQVKDFRLGRVTGHK